jgi:hypothetical protein
MDLLNTFRWAGTPTTCCIIRTKSIDVATANRAVRVAFTETWADGARQEKCSVAVLAWALLFFKLERCLDSAAKLPYFC